MWYSIMTILAVLLAGCAADTESTAQQSTHALPAAGLRDPRERHLANIRQLTFGGQNAEAYFSADGTQLVFQSTRGMLECDQIFTMRVDGRAQKMVSTGSGRTTCAYWAPDGGSIVYASTHLASPGCPPPPDYSQGYVWAVYGSFDIFRADLQGGNLVRLTSTPGYDAEAVFSNDGSRILFTSARDGDLELYTMDPDGSNLRRLTHAVGYDGGAFYSPDDSMICWRADRPSDSAAIRDFRSLLAQELIRPSELELFVMRADGSDQLQVTHLGGANFCPYFTPDGGQLVFSSNHHSETGREFDLFMIGIDGRGLEQITFTSDFDGFPMFSPDGRLLVWCSNRNGQIEGETNVFIAEWIE
jgi:Tol biopolymer transport system component